MEAGGREAAAAVEEVVEEDDEEEAECCCCGCCFVNSTDANSSINGDKYDAGARSSAGLSKLSASP